MTEFLSDHLKATRDAFKGHVHGGKVFSSDEIIGLVERFDELVAMALAQENLLSRHQWNEAARLENSINFGHQNCRSAVVKALPDNVVAFPGAGVPRHPSGGAA